MIVGIDLGTTNSAIAYWHGGEPRLIPNALKGELTPSAVSIEKNGAVHIGSSALDRMAFAPELTATSFKRWMGTKQSVRLGRGKPHDATEMSAMVLRSLLDDAEAHLGERPTEAVITVPAYFNDKQRKATRRAGEMAGVVVRRLINEPTAAALAFGLQDKEDREPFLVFDLGGGTFDVSIVEKFENIIEVRASSGDNRLGGDDFNEALIALAAPRLDANKALEALSPAKRNALLFLAAERARRALSTASSTEFSIVVEGKEISTVVTAEEFSAAADPLLKRLKEPVVRALRDCQMNPGDLSEIVLVGGATRMPIVRNALTRMFGRFPNNSIHPDHAVALGAAVQAGLLSGGTDLEEVRITDVAPFSMGIDVAERDQFGRMRTGIFSPIIERNTPVPCSREQVYSTMEPYQKAIKMGVYQGEARMVEQNVELRKFEIRVPERREPVSLIVRFSYDSSGLLEIDTHVPDTGESKTFLIVDDEDRADRAELEKRRQALAKLKFHPREDTENVALAARAARCYEGHLGEMRNMVGHWIQLFEGALESQDPKEIAHAREQLSANLDTLDSQSPL